MNIYTFMLICKFSNAKLNKSAQWEWAERLCLYKL